MLVVLGGSADGRGTCHFAATTGTWNSMPGGVLAPLVATVNLSYGARLQGGLV
jgi:hypothetical protein